MRGIVKSLLVLSTFSTTCFGISIAFFIKAGLTIEVVCLLVCAFLLGILGWLLVLQIKNVGEAMPIQIKKIESNDSIIIPFMATYFVPAMIKIKIEDALWTYAGTIVLILIGLTVSYLPIHPILRAVGFRFYKCETHQGLVITVIAKRNIRDAAALKNVIRVSENLFIEKENNESFCFNYLPR
jgi:hypothetical protein